MYTYEIQCNNICANSPSSGCPIALKSVLSFADVSISPRFLCLLYAKIGISENIFLQSASL